MNFPRAASVFVIWYLVGRLAPSSNPFDFPIRGSVPSSWPRAKLASYSLLPAMLFLSTRRLPCRGDNILHAQQLVVSTVVFTHDRQVQRPTPPSSSRVDGICDTVSAASASGDEQDVDVPDGAKFDVTRHGAQGGTEAKNAALRDPTCGAAGVGAAARSASRGCR